MKIGVILIFNDSEKELTTKFRALFNEKCKAKICFVNNASKDDTLEILKDIKDSFDTISILDIKKNRGVDAAVKAGVRYLGSKEDFNYILYLKLTDFKNLEKLLSLVKEKSELIQKIARKNTRRILNNVYSMNEFLEKKLE